MKSCLSLTPSPTRLTRPSLARASAILSRNNRSSLLGDVSSSPETSVSASLRISSVAVDLAEGVLFGAWTYSAILVRIQCVGLLHKFQRNVKYECGTGVVMSGDVYLKLTG